MAFKSIFGLIRVQQMLFQIETLWQQSSQQLESCYEVGLNRKLFIPANYLVNILSAILGRLILVNWSLLSMLIEGRYNILTQKKIMSLPVGDIKSVPCVLLWFPFYTAWQLYLIDPCYKTHELTSFRLMNLQNYLKGSHVLCNYYCHWGGNHLALQLSNINHLHMPFYNIILIFNVKLSQILVNFNFFLLNCSHFIASLPLHCLSLSLSEICVLSTAGLSQ